MAKQTDVDLLVCSAGFIGKASSTAGSIGYAEEIAATLKAGQETHVLCYDIGEARLRTPSEYKDLCPTLSARCGTGGNNVLAICFNPTQITSPLNWSNPQPGDPCHTLSANCLPPTICIAGNTIDREIKNGGNGAGFQEDVSYTLNTVDRHAVATYQTVTGPLMANSHPGAYSGQDAYQDMFVTENQIVRRLTPTECARLQGFPDWWCADIPHSDSAEYKMWGNGVALPCVVYVMEGIAIALREETGNA